MTQSTAPIPGSSPLRVALVAVAFLPLLLILWLLPPTWNYIDSSIYILQSARSNFPHYPPLYLFFTQSIHDLASGIWPHLGSGYVRVLTDSGVYGVVVVQLLLFSFSLLYFASILPVGYGSKIAAVVLICANLNFLVLTGGFYSEGLSISLLIFQFAALFDLLGEKPRTLSWIVFPLAAYFGIETRHAVATYIWALPCMGAALYFYGRTVSAKRVLAFLLISLTIYGATKATAAGFCSLWQSECTPIVGRAGVYRFYEAQRVLPESEREAQVARLQEKTDDRFLKETIHIMFTDTHPWSGSVQRLWKIFNETPREQWEGWSADLLLNAAFKLYLTNPDSALFTSIGNSFYLYLTRTIGGNVDSIIQNSVNSLDLYHKEHLSPNYRNLTSTALAQSSHFDAFTKSSIVTSLRNIAYWHITLFTVLVTTACIARKKITPRVAVYVIGCQLFGWGSLLLVSIITCTVVRYMAVTEVLLFLSLGSLVTCFGSRGTETKRSFFGQ